LDWEVSISGSERRDERVLPGLDCPLSGVHSVVVGLYQLQFALFFGEELLYVLRGLVVHDVEFEF
jgi:hypothetical protein